MRTLKSLATLVVLALVVAGAVALRQGVMPGAPTSLVAAEESVSTPFGPLSAADRDMLAKVRRAGLWEHPVGQEARERAAEPKVREIADKISNEHQELDRLVIDAAEKLGVDLPNQPTAQQQGWMTEISTASRADYDSIMVNRLRQAHGLVLPLLSSIRGSTQNEVVRDFADVSTVFVRRHIGYLESTGLVDFEALPPSTVPGTNPWTTWAYVAGAGVAVVIIGLLLVIASMRRNERRRQGSVVQASARHADFGGSSQLDARPEYRSLPGDPRRADYRRLPPSPDYEERDYVASRIDSRRAI